MKKRIILYLLSFIFWGCSSTSEKKPETSREESEYVAETKSLGDEVKIGSKMCYINKEGKVVWTQVK